MPPAHPKSAWLWRRNLLLARARQVCGTGRGAQDCDDESDRAVGKHIGSTFQKLGLVEESETNRRVLAVLAFLDATRPPP